MAFELYYDRLIEEFPQIEYVVMDAGYKTPAIARKVLESSALLFFLTSVQMEKMVISGHMSMLMMNFMIA